MPVKPYFMPISKSTVPVYMSFILQDFLQDDEYAIYNPNQQYLAYLVEFTLDNDKIKVFSPTSVIADTIEDDNIAQKGTYWYSYTSDSYHISDMSLESKDPTYLARISISRL